MEFLRWRFLRPIFVAAQLQTIFNAHLAPKVTFDDPFTPAPDGDDIPASDDRSRAQRQHDAFAAALAVAAASGELPTIGGHAPTLVLSVDAADLASGTGYAHVQGCDEPVSMQVARHIGCGAVIQRVALGAEGRIMRIGVEDRVFNRYQRRAIALRDGGCIIPGCGVPAGWCEIITSRSTPAGARPTPTTACCCAGTTTASWSASAGRFG